MRNEQAYSLHLFPPLGEHCPRSSSSQASSFYDGVCLTLLLAIVFYEQNGERVEKLENSEASLISIGNGREIQQAGDKKNRLS